MLGAQGFVVTNRGFCRDRLNLPTGLGKHMKLLHVNNLPGSKRPTELKLCHRVRWTGRILLWHGLTPSAKLTRVLDLHPFLFAS
jgi:hypothetical protein